MRKELDRMEPPLRKTVEDMIDQFKVLFYEAKPEGSVEEALASEWHMLVGLSVAIQEMNDDYNKRRDEHYASSTSV